MGNIKYKKPKLDVDFFKEVDTEEKAYFLGLLYADGCNNIERNTVKIVLQERDREILERFRIAIKLKKQLSIHRLDNNPKFKNAQNACRLEIYNKLVCERLINLGCTPRKSLTLEFPSTNIVPEYLQQHFVRGYFDGDGCISFTKSKYKNQIYYSTQFSLCSTEKFCMKLKEIILIKLNIECRIRKIKALKNDSNTRIIQVSGKKTLKIFDWLYGNTDLYIERKFNKYVESQEYAKPRKEQKCQVH